MVKIRLKRTGRKHQPHYRIVAADSRSPRDGRFIEKIGYYNPRTKPPTLQYDKDILTKWMDNGAQMTDTVHDIFVREGIIKQSSKRKASIAAIIKASKKRKAGEQVPEKKEPEVTKTEVKQPEVKETKVKETETKKPEAPKEKESKVEKPKVTKEKDSKTEKPQASKKKDPKTEKPQASKEKKSK